MTVALFFHQYAPSILAFLLLSIHDQYFSQHNVNVNVIKYLVTYGLLSVPESDGNAVENGLSPI